MLVDLVPFLVFGGAFLIAFFVFCHFAKKTRTESKVSEPIPVVDLETLVVLPEAAFHPELDPQLASVLIYPGAVPVKKTVAEGPGSQRGELSVTYWTPDPIETVWEHYRRELPDWAETLSQQARELIYRTDAHSCLIRVYDKDGRTLIEATVKPAQYNRNNLFSQN
ncbi:hypothetical protein SBA7_120050 [Candidatus Sulfotelmatobacter sp. SbA7]|nr:hypothetical protein SBA7_120050 [Candidatus Sulfotelmatobacter sp. SbA7]